MKRSHLTSARCGVCSAPLYADERERGTCDDCDDSRELRISSLQAVTGCDRLLAVQAVELTERLRLLRQQMGRA